MTDRRWAWVAAPAFLLGLGAGAAMVVRDCALSCNVGFRMVPLAWLAIAALAVPFVALQVGLLRRVRFATWQVASPLVIAACLAGFHAWTTRAVDANPYGGPDGRPAAAVQAAYLAYYVWIDPALVLLFTNLVRLGARVFDGAVERGLAVLAPSALAGGMAGSALARALVPALVDAGVRYEHARDGLLLVFALCLCAIAGVARAVAARFPDPPAAPAPATGVLADARAVLADPAVALAGGVLVLTGAAAVLVDYLFFWTVAEQVDRSQGRTAWFATFYLVLNGVTLALQLFGTSRLVAKLGLTAALLTLPLAAAAGGGWLAVAPSLAAVCALRIARDALTRSLFEPATERLMVLVGGARYEAVRTVLGGLGFSLGMGLGGAVALALRDASRAAVAGALVAIAAAWVALVVTAARRAAPVTA